LYITRGEEQFDVASLRQGDILEGVPFPLMDYASLQLLGGIPTEPDYNELPPLQPKLHQHREDAGWTTATVPVRFGFCTVLSNCCDLEPRNGKILAHTIVLARLRPIPDAIRNNPENFNSLVANKDPRDRTNAGYLDYFYMEPHELLAQQDWRVQFNLVVCIPTSGNIDLMLRKKILQLDDRTRMKFKIKLGFTYMRPNDDELGAGLENPWEPAPQEQ
jgi:hypothetical protein